MKKAKAKAREIQQNIRLVLLRDWDPIGVHDEPMAQDEYDAYVGSVYRLLASGATEQQIAEHLWCIERDTMRLPSTDSAKLLPVAKKLGALHVKL